MGVLSTNGPINQSRILHMTLRKHICPVALLVVALTFLCVGSNAFGQALQPPFMAPTPPSLAYGVFYFQAGAKYRNLHTFTMNVSGGPSTIVVSPGTIPFGPTTAGDFGVGTGKLGFDGVTAPTTWTYDNGSINATPTPPGGALGCAGPPAIPDCGPGDAIFVYSAIQPELGRFVFISARGGCCAGTSAPGEIGSFSIVDPTTQVNNLESIAGTTKVTFSAAILDSLAYTANTGGLERVFEGAVVGPSLEMGYQWSNYFDFFYGFSWFTASNSLSVTSVIQGQGSRTTIIDTFPFLSDDTSPWPVFNFNSSISVVGTDPTHNYRIAPNGPGQGIFPNRQFGTQADATVVTEDIQDTITNTAEFTPLENRFGARSWAPLWGLGRFGAILGGAIIPTYYKITGSRTDIALGPPNGAVAPGTLLAAQATENKEWRTLYGGFVGADLMLGNTGYFLYGSADYMWANNLSYQLGSVTTIFNPGGFTAGFSAGVQF
jgi:hypothetical protein